MFPNFHQGIPIMKYRVWQVLEANLNLFQPGGADYAHHIFTDVLTKFWKPQVRLILQYYKTYNKYLLKNKTARTVRNHVKLGVSLRVPYRVMDTGYGLGRSLGDCRPALLKGWKYQMVKTQTESHNRRQIVWTNWCQIWVSFSFEVFY